MKKLISFKSIGGAALVAALEIQTLACGGDYAVKKPFTVHEWGTFTSVQGSDGVQMNWQPLATSDLPPFVYNLFRPSSSTNKGDLEMLFSKTSLIAKQRMETPVLYFYSPVEQTVNVQVNFPKGKMTEWYPEANRWGSAHKVTPNTLPSNEEGILHWKEVRILSNEQRKENEQKIPSEQSGSHYYAARGVDANFVSTRNALGKEEIESFLFYRGIAHFDAPLKVTIASDSRYLILENTGDGTLHNLIVLNVKGEQGKHVQFDSLKATERREVPWSDIEDSPKPLSTVHTEVSTNLHTALTSQGLFPKEATSMINTWRASWLGEQGLRVLYVLPEEWTDRTLPLKVTPRPERVERVMVGRAEVITPQMEWSLMQQLVKFSSGSDQAKHEAVKECITLGMGRFTDPALRRVVGPNPSKELQVKLSMFKDAVERASAAQQKATKKALSVKEDKTGKFHCASIFDLQSLGIWDWLDCGC